MPSKVGHEEAAGEAAGTGVAITVGVGAGVGTTFATTAAGEASGAAPVGRNSRVHPANESNEKVAPQAARIQHSFMTMLSRYLRKVALTTYKYNVLFDG